MIDPARFRGTCYRAATWIVLGRTTGTRQERAEQAADSVDQKRGAGLSVTLHFREPTRRGLTWRRRFPDIELHIYDLERLVERARHTRPSDDEYNTLKAAIHTLGYVAHPVEANAGANRGRLTVNND